MSYYIFYGNFLTDYRRKSKLSSFQQAKKQFDNIQLGKDIHFVDLMKVDENISIVLETKEISLEEYLNLMKEGDIHGKRPL